VIKVVHDSDMDDRKFPAFKEAVGKAEILDQRFVRKVT
jgi:hypothetical protein